MSRGRASDRPARATQSHPALAWAASGAMALTGPAGGAPVVAPCDLPGCARDAIEALRLLAEGAWRGGALDGAALLGERAAITGLGRRGTVSPGGACRLFPTTTGWIAINLPRDEDLASLPAWLGEPVRGDPWDFVAERVARRAARMLVARARLLGLAAAEAVSPSQRARPWRRIEQCAPPAPRRRPAPLVVDLSALWAGPLATHLLALAGAHVIKVESVHRPDGARRGAPAFFDRLNAGKQSVALDLHSAADRARLRALIASCDIVVESARPRALAQLGLDARELVASIPGLTWVGITGYGRTGPGANWIAFGDDAAVAAGLATATGAAASPLFCADAVADPLTGLYAAVAALDSWRRGGGQLVDVALRDVVAAALASDPGDRDAPVEVRRSGQSGAEPAWEIVADGRRERVAPPRARPASGVARPLGADTDAILRHLTV